MHRAVFGLCAALFVFAFVAAPHSCEWGLGAYFWTGVVLLLVGAVLPFVPAFRPAVRSPVLQALLYFALVFAVWVAGLFAANVRILCRLF